MSQIRKVVITGGPCGGKSAAHSHIRAHFEKQGWKVLITPEIATLLIGTGIAPWTCGSSLQYQICQMGLQLKTEETFLRAAKCMDASKILIVCDRGLFDGLAYMTEQEFDFALDVLGTDRKTLAASYDAVFHMETVGAQFPDIYEEKKANNPARTEDIAAAVNLDKAVLKAWRSSGVDVRTIAATSSYDDKVAELLNQMDTQNRPDLAAVEAFSRLFKQDVFPPK